MIKFKFTNYLLDCIVKIERCKTLLECTDVPFELSNRFRKNTRKRSSYASNIIEGNPLSYEQACDAIDNKTRHLLKPEQEIINYYLAIDFLSNQLKNKEPFSISLLLEVQKLIVNGEHKDNIGFRKPTPPGVLFAVYDDKTGVVDYIPPEANDVIPLMNELVEYINTSSDHPLVKAAVCHYQLVTIHPFGDGNGRTARIISNYLLSYYGYGFKEIGSLEEYFAFDLDEYYGSLQMGLPSLYYQGRNDPPNPEIWFNYFFKVMCLYATKVVDITSKEISNVNKLRAGTLSIKAQKLYAYLKRNNIKQFTPILLAARFKVTNRTIINWCLELSNNGFVKPNIVKERIISYQVLD